MSTSAATLTAMALDTSVLIGSDGSNDYYFIASGMLDHHVILSGLRRVTIAVTYTWPGGVVGLWPVPKAEETRIACWKSARAAYEFSRMQWVQLIWNGERRDYDVAVAEGISTEPMWPGDLNLKKLLRLGLDGKIIDSPEHHYVLQLKKAPQIAFG
jgi:hypothetical protein